MSGRAVIEEYYKIRLYFILHFIDVIDLPSVGIQFNFVFHVLIFLEREACKVLIGRGKGLKM